MEPTVLGSSSKFFSDLIDHLRGPGFFTTVAGTGVLGAQYVLLLADYRTGLLLWVVALVLWIGLSYAIFTAFTVKEQKPTLDKGISGAWLLARGGDAIGRRARCAAGRACRPVVSARIELSGAVDVAVGWHALHLDDVADFLPLHLLPAGVG